MPSEMPEAAREAQDAQIAPPSADQPSDAAQYSQGDDAFFAYLAAKQQGSSASAQAPDAQASAAPAAQPDPVVPAHANTNGAAEAPRPDALTQPAAAQPSTPAPTPAHVPAEPAPIDYDALASRVAEKLAQRIPAPAPVAPQPAAQEQPPAQATPPPRWEMSAEQICEAQARSDLGDAPEFLVKDYAAALRTHQTWEQYDDKSDSETAKQARKALSKARTEMQRIKYYADQEARSKKLESELEAIRKGPEKAKETETFRSRLLDACAPDHPAMAAYPNIVKALEAKAITAEKLFERVDFSQSPEDLARAVDHVMDVFEHAFSLRPVSILPPEEMSPAGPAPTSSAPSPPRAPSQASAPAPAPTPDELRARAAAKYSPGAQALTAYPQVAEILSSGSLTINQILARVDFSQAPEAVEHDVAHAIATLDHVLAQSADNTSAAAPRARAATQPPANSQGLRFNPAAAEIPDARAAGERTKRYLSANEHDEQFRLFAQSKGLN